MIVSKQELTQLVKEELTRTLKEAGFGLFDKGTMSMKPSQMTQEEQEEVREVRQAIDDLYLTIEEIAYTYNDLKTNKAKEIFEKYLVENIDMYVNKWRKEREGVE
jgi:vacuolar-type H+-ATPase subunit I/STV1